LGKEPGSVFRTLLYREEKPWFTTCINREFLYNQPQELSIIIPVNLVALQTCHLKWTLNEC